MEPTTDPPLLVSVVITNHNYAQFLDDAIESVLDQDHPAVELVVVDDGSTDGSHEIIATHSGRLTAVHSGNHGQGHAINVGFALTAGDVVIFLDADDRLHRSAARRVADVFRRHPHVARVQMPLDLIDDTGQPVGRRLPAPGRSLFGGDARARLLSCPDDIAWQPTSGNAFARRVLERILPMDPDPYRLCADYHLSTLSPLHGHVAVLDGIAGDYRVHGRNGHVRRVTLERIRDDVRRTLVTRSTLIAHSRRMGLPGLPDDPRDVLSVSHTALRALSYRLDRSHHEVAGDDRGRLLRLGIRSLVARRDLDTLRRLMVAIWLAALLVLPRPVVRLLAAPLLGGPVAG